MFLTLVGRTKFLFAKDKWKELKLKRYLSTWKNTVHLNILFQELFLPVLKKWKITWQPPEIISFLFVFQFEMWLLPQLYLDLYLKT